MRAFRQWRWHLDEMYVKINGDMHYLWRAVDHEGEVLESFATKTRDKAAALCFMKKAMKRYGRPEKIVTDGLRSWRERAMQGFHRMKTLPKFSSVHALQLTEPCTDELNSFFSTFYSFE